MNPGGIVVLMFGVWVGFQVFGGDALNRLGITGTGSSSATGKPAVATSPATGPRTMNA